MLNESRLLQRFLRYVSVDTTANADTQDYPSSPGQLELGRLVAGELEEIGLEVEQDQHGIVTATLAESRAEAERVVTLCAHFDTSPETTGKNVRPQVIESYPGGDITLPGDRSQVIRVEENPELAELEGRTLITTDGTTLLGADDKAGIAVIVETAAYLAEHPQIPHGPVRILLTCDEEIGRGVDHVDVDKLTADVCYTLDGPAFGQMDVETFSADLATVHVRGVNIHPSIAKGKMVNALRAAGEFLAALPRETLSPETTEDREGFLHPYTIEGGVAEARIRVLLRDFDTAQLVVQAELLRRVAADVQQQFPGSRIDVDIERQYRNLGDGLKQFPPAVECVEEAYRRLGRTLKKDIIRGGTDGSLLTEQGLPTPNLSTGQHNPHSPLEFACLEEMREAAEVLIELLQVWAER